MAIDDEEGARRRAALFEEALGPDLRWLLRREGTTDLLINADGKVWVDSVQEGRRFSGYTITPRRAETLLRLIAFAFRSPLTRKTPILDNAKLPTGERIAGTIFPVTHGPTMAIRVPYSATVDASTFTVGKSERAKVDTAGFVGDDIGHLLDAAEEGRGIILAGATGSGKTTLMNCLLQRMSKQRLVVMEDTEELVIPAEDHVRFLAVAGTVDLARLLQLSLRYRLDRPVVGELRTPTATAVFLEAANTGHGGGLTTLHANSAAHAIDRIEDLVRASANPMPARAIHSAVDIVAFLEKQPDNSRRITEIIDIKGREHVRSAA